MNFVEFIDGATCIALAGSSLFFFRYWNQTRDPLFIYFCLAFSLFCLCKLAVLFSGESADFMPFAYSLRLGGFILIIAAIAQKNMQNGKK